MCHASYAERFASKTARATDLSPNGMAGCIVWTGGTQGGGYGIFNAAGCPRLAHRLSYEMRVGPIPPGLELDHLCTRPACVNPYHLEPVTSAENKRRGKRTKLTADKVREIRALKAAGHHSESIAARYGVCKSNVNIICRRASWADID